MIRRFRVLAFVVAATLLVSGSVIAATQAIKVTVNGEGVSFKTPPQMEDNQVLVPVAELAEALGVEATWDAETNTLKLVDNRIRNLSNLQIRIVQLEAELRELRNGKSDSSSEKAATGDMGRSRTNPAPVGTTVRAPLALNNLTFEADFTVREVIRGDEAWQRTLAANRFNDPAPAGYEYMLVRIEYKLVSSSDPEAAVNVTRYWFTAVSGSGKDYKTPVVSGLKPEVSGNLYAGASSDGWLGFLVAKNDAVPVMTFARDNQGKSGYWFELRTTTTNRDGSTNPASQERAITTPSTAAELEIVLNEKYRVVSTPLGDLTLTYRVNANNRTWFPWDYRILADYGTSSFFLDLRYKVGVSDQVKQETVDKLKAHAKQVYDLASETLPGKKVRGEYYHGWYEYPALQVGYKSNSFLCWQNYTDNLLGRGMPYENAVLTTFHFEPRWDTAELP